MREACERDGLELLVVHEELDVSGGAALEERAGLSAAVDAVERGEADVVMVAYFDRLFRELRVQHEVVEWTVERMHRALEGIEGRASADERARAAGARAERSQAALDGAIAALRGLGDEPAAIDKLRELRDARDRDRAEAEHLRGLASALSVDSRRDWHRLTLPERRGLIREVVGTVWVTKGRGTGRLRAEMLVE